MDNLIAEGKAKPFLIVMTYGMTNEGTFGGRGGRRELVARGGATADGAPAARGAGVAPAGEANQIRGAGKVGEATDAVDAAAFSPVSISLPSRPFSSTN